MDLYYRGYDPNERITSAGRHLTAAAARFASSIVRSIPLLPEASWAALKRLATVDALWSLCLVLAGWLIATVVGGLVGLAVNALLMIYGLIELWEEVQGVWDSLKEWAKAAYEAQRDAELDRAAQHFAAALSTGGITILEVLMTHRVFRAVEGKLRERFPVPDWLRQQHEEAVRQREAPRRTTSATEELLRKTADAVTSGSRGEGARRVAHEFPVAAVVGGVLFGAGALAALSWALTTTEHRARVRARP